MALLSSVIVFSAFTTASNVPTTVGFVPEPSCGRGTIDILWQCFTTIVLCIYTVPHLDVPPVSLSKLQSFWRRIYWVGIGLIAPELIVYSAMGDLKFAYQIARYFDDNGGFKISLKQAHFIGGGGLRLRLEKDDKETFRNIRFLCNSKISLTEKTICAQFLFDNLPSDRAIDDLSKTDALAKIITTVQAVWTATIIVGRAATSLDVSLLEVETASYVSVALMAYLCWWFKPYGVSTSIELESPVAFKYLELHRSSFTGPVGITWDWDTSDPQIDEKDTLLNSLLCFIIACYSGIHCAAWNYAFASTTETIFWRVSSVLVGALPLAIASTLYMTNMRMEKTVTIIIVVSTVLYICSRLFLIIEVFLAFRSAPIGIYIDFSWTGYIGHVGS